MATCPNNHESDWPDYCSVCGAQMGTSTRPASPELPPKCPACDEPRHGLFCEKCGHDYNSPQTPPDTWTAIITTDRSYFESSPHASRVRPPASWPPRNIPLAGATVRIGRRSHSRAITPEIDLSYPPEDHAVSRDHAQLRAQPDGSWALYDHGSGNGTYLNGQPERIPTDCAAQITDGDYIHLGLWTRITFRRETTKPT